MHEENLTELRAWHVSVRHIVAASTSETAMSYARSIGLGEQDGLFATAQELSVFELAEPCWTGGGDEAWRQDSIGNFLKETSAPRLLCESLPMNEFGNGVLFAVAKLVQTHGVTVEAADVLKAADLANGDVPGFDPYDQQFLLPLNNESGIKLTGFAPRDQMAG